MKPTEEEHMTNTTQPTDVMRELATHAQNVTKEAEKPKANLKTNREKLTHYLQRFNASPRTCVEISEATGVGMSSASSFLSQAAIARQEQGSKEGVFAIEQTNGPRLYHWGFEDEVVGKYGDRIVSNKPRARKPKIKQTAMTESEPETIQTKIKEAVEKYIDEMVEAGELQRVTEPLFTLEIFAHACEMSHDDAASLIASLGAA